ncbi:MAG: hypothetical protein Q9221_007524 [Calogaya cf. arnoldii]
MSNPHTFIVITVGGMNVLLSAAAGLLAAEALCKKRRSTSRRVTRVPMSSSSSHSSSSESSASPSPSHHKRRRKQRISRSSSESSISPHHKRRRKHRIPMIRSPTAPPASTTSRLLALKDPTNTDADSSDLSTDSSESTVTHLHRICHGRLPKNIKHRNHLPDYNTLMTRYVSPERYSSSDTSSDETSSSVTVSSSSSSDLDADSDSESTTSNNSDSSSSITSSSSASRRPLPPVTNPTPSTLHSRLSTFLPTIRASNAELERERLAGTLHNRNIENFSSTSDSESEGGEKPYIEMDFGLGVLEEKSGAGDITPVGMKRERSRESETGRSAVAEGVSPLETLMGGRGAKPPEARERKRRKVGIEVVD